jgi:pyruvate/2-oxoacid:ferredoxin oxidoreductase alpha subunit
LRFKDRFSIFRPITISPVLEEELREAAKEHKRVIVAEMNAGQYATLVEAAILRRVERLSVLGGELDLQNIGGKLRWITQHG